MIGEVTATLVDLLDRYAGFGPNWVEISSLESDATLTNGKLHVCLYSIEEHAHLRNQPPVSTARGYERAPLALRLNYVMTYLGDHAEAQVRLARVAEVFHAKPILGPADLLPALRPHTERLTVRLHTPSMEERTGLWTAYGRGLRLALYYEADVALIVAPDQEGHGRVLEHRVDYAEVRR